MRFSVRAIGIKDEECAKKEMSKIGVDPAGIRLMTPKQFHYNLKCSGLTPPQANIIKQEMLAAGADAAVSRGVIECSVESTDCILSATHKQFGRFIKKLSTQPYGLKEFSYSVGRAIENINRKEFVFRGRRKTWTISGETLIMGILNVTPDSFSDGGRFSGRQRAVERALEMAEQGADIIDVGGESTRPGSSGVGLDEEMERVIPVIEEIAKKAVAISVDTTKAAVADEALKKGAEIINDISAMTKDKAMAEVIARHKAGVILMHMRGTPETMQENTRYGDLMGEIFDYLSGRMDYAISMGIDADNIVVDPGIGFAKRAQSNVEIIMRLNEIKSIGRPVLLGASRKSFIGAMLGKVEEGRLIGSIAAVIAAILNGANIVRVHDVKESKEAARMADAIKNSISGDKKQ